MAGYDNLDDAELDMIAEAEGTAHFSCIRPLRILGIQSDSPLAWNVDGTRLAFVSGSATIYVAVLTNVGTPQESFEIEHLLADHRNTVNALCFHPTLPILASCDRIGINIWDITEGELLTKISEEANYPRAHEASVESIAWIYDGEFLVSGSRDTNIHIWDVSDGYRCVEILTGHKASILDMTFCAANHLMASAGRDSQIMLWDVSTLTGDSREARKDDGSIKVNQKAVLDGHRGDVTCLAWGKGGAILFSGARDNDIKIWDVETRSEIRTITGHKGDIRKITLMNDDALLFSASNDSTVKLWELAEIEVTGAEGILDLGTLGLDANILGNYGDGPADDAGGIGPASPEAAAPISILDVIQAKDRCILDMPAHETTIFGMAVNAAMPYMATSSIDNCVRIWNIRDLLNPQCIAEFVGHGAAINAVNMLHKDQHVLSASLDYNIFFYNVASIQRLAQFNFLGSVNCMTVNSAQTLVFAGGTHYDVKAYSLQQDSPNRYQLVAIFRGHAGRVEAISVSPDNGTMVTGGHDFDILVWPIEASYELDASGNARVCTPAKTETAHSGHVTQLEYNETGSMVASSSTDHSLIVWTASRRSLSKRFKIDNAHDSVVSSVCWGRQRTADSVATCSWDKTIKIWDATGRKDQAPKVLTAHSAKVTDVSSSVCGRFLISSASDCSVRVWAFDGALDCIAIYQTPLSEGPFICVDGGQYSFVSGSENGMLRVWPLPVEQHMDTCFIELDGVSKIVAEKEKEEAADDDGPLRMQIGAGVGGE